MKHLSRAFALALLLQFVSAGAPRAATQCLPDPASCTLPAFIHVVGTQSGVPDTAGLFTIVIHGYGNVPMGGVQVVLDFSNVSDVRLCSTQPAFEALDCATHTIRSFTDAQGRVQFLVLGAARNRGGDPGDGHANIAVYADGVPLGNLSATAADENGAITVPGVEATDLSALIRDIGQGIYVLRSDFNQDGRLGAVDLSSWLAFYRGNGSRSGCNGSSFCP